MNKHCDSVSIDEAYELMRKLNIKEKGEFATLCGVDRKQFSRWENKGRMPQYRLSVLRETLHLQAKKKYDKLVGVLYEDITL